MGICSEQTFELLLSGRSIEVFRETEEKGKTLVWLWPEYCSTPPWLWVYKEFTRSCCEEKLEVSADLTRGADL